MPVQRFANPLRALRLMILGIAVALSICLGAAATGPQGQKPSVSHWWDTEPLRIIDLVKTPELLSSYSPKDLVKLKTERGYNAEHIYLLDLIGDLDDKGLFLPPNQEQQRSRKYLDQYLSEAGKAGLRVFAYVNVHSFSMDMGTKHPDWMQRDEAGKPIDNVYSVNTSFCVNSPWRDWCFNILDQLCRYPIAGVFYDGPIFFAETCYCASCRAKFEKQYGRALPGKKRRRGKDSADLLEFQAASLRDFLRDSRRVIKSWNPELAFYMNGGEREGNWRTGRLNRVLVAEQDILGSEGGFLFGDLTRLPVWKPGVMARLLETQSAGKPRVIFSAGGHKPWTFSLLPAAELRLLYAQTIANAASVWFGVFPYEFGLPEAAAVTEMNRFLAANKAYYQETRSEAATAIVWSEATADFYPSSSLPRSAASSSAPADEVGSPAAEFSGFVEGLIRARIPFDVIDEARLDAGNLGRYRLILLANVACMSDSTASRLEDYVRQGGSVLASFETSLYDETGTRRKDLALSRVLGATSKNEVIGPKPWDYMKKAAENPLLAGLDREFLPSSIYSFRVEARGARTLLHYTKPLVGRYAGVPELSRDPALLVHLLGRGRAFYFTGDLGASLHAYHLPELFLLLENGLREMAPAAVEVEAAAGYCDVVLRSQENGRRLIVHLLNFTAEMTRPARRIVPLRDVRLRHDSLAKARKIFSLVRPMTLIPQKDALGRAFVDIPVLDEYEVVVIEK